MYVALKLSTVAPQQWDPTAALAAAFQYSTDSQNSTDFFRTYYIGANKQVYEQFKRAGSWSAQSDQSPVWQSVDRVGAGIAAVGWLDQIRLYYISDGRLVEEALNGTTWSRGQEW